MNRQHKRLAILQSDPNHIPVPSKLDRPTLMTAQPEELVRRLDSDDNGGILRLEIAVKTLIEESYLYPDEEQAMLQKARQSWNIYKRTTTHFLWNA